MQRRFVTLDVFTSRRFAGNPLAVVLDAEGLDTPAMQAIAREFNLSETVFVAPPKNKAHRADIRIFTPALELPFAGHPTIGTAVLLACEDASAAADLVLQEKVGPVTCRVTTHKDGGNARFSVPKMPVREGDAPGAEQLAKALSLSPQDIGFGTFCSGRWSAGNPFVFAPIRTLEAVKRSKPDLNVWDSALGTVPVGIFLFCNDCVDSGHHFHARMFAPTKGVMEDPATGSAAAAFAGLLAKEAGLPDGEHAIDVEQGYEMGRPSLIRLFLTLRDSALTHASIGGDAVIVSRGIIEA